MPFDPHIVPADEPPLDEAGELVFPDDLTELAAQLGDDARHLSAFYPATLPSRMAASDDTSAAGLAATLNAQIDKDEEAGHVRYSSRRLMQAITAAAAVVGLVATISMWRWMPENADEPKERSIMAEVPNDRENTSPVNAVIAPHRLPTEADSVPSVPSFTPSPAFFLHEYSEPELEGIYDLLGESPEDKISI